MFKRNRTPKPARYSYKIESHGYVPVTVECSDRNDALSFFGELSATRPDATHILFEVDHKNGTSKEIIRHGDIHPTNR